MDDSDIFDLDNVMEDSFFVNDDDVLKILQTWKLTGYEDVGGSNCVGETGNAAAAAAAAATQRFFDSRTFTRPKKKMPQYPTDFETVNSISPQIGGALSNSFGMQRSLINDVSPPSSLASSSISYDCGNSLITSGDFSNVTCLLDGNSDSFVRMSSFRRSRFTSRLADFDEAKDDSVAKTDMHGIDGGSSGNSTLQNSIEGEATFVKNENKTFNRNATFDADADATFTTPVLNKTFEKVSNATFSATPEKENPPDEDEDEDAFQSPVLRRPLLIQSTPRHAAVNIQVEDLSPITTNPPVLRRSRCPDEDKRISLQNFEDVEKSISLLESNNGDMEAFDAILEEMTDLQKPLEREKQRQHLQNIKNRHSLNLERSLNMEKEKKTFDNSLIESMTTSGERLLRRSRLDDDISAPSPPLPPHAATEDTEKPTTTATLAADRKNRDRFKTMRITKKHIEGMIVVDDVTGKEIEVVAVDQDEPELNQTFKKPESVPFKARSLSKPRFYSGLPQKRDLRLNLGAGKASSVDHLDSNRMESTENLAGTAPPKSNMKSPMGIKSKSYHNLTFNSQPSVNGGAQQRPVSRMTRPSGLSLLPSSMGSNQFKTPINSGLVAPQSRLQSGLKRPVTASIQQPRPKSFVRTPSAATADSVNNNLNTTKTIATSGLAKKTGGGLVRPSSGYYNYNNVNSRRLTDSDTESGRYSPNSLSSSSASSRGSLYPPEVGGKIQSSVEDVSQESPNKPQASRIARPSGLKPPSTRSALPRFGFVKR